MPNLIESVFIHGNASMSAKTRFVVQFIVTMEGIVATILFCILFAFLFIVQFDKLSGAYRAFLIVSAVHGFLLSSMLIPLNFLHLIRNGDFVNIALGFGTDFVSPENFRLLILFFTNLVSYSWELVPTASMLQFVSLTKPQSSFAHRLCLAYAWPVIAFGFNFLYVPYFIPAPAYREVLAKNARDFYQIHDHQRVYVYGFPFLPKRENGAISAIDVAIKFAAPTYSISYGLFLFNVFRIKKNLASFGVRLSETLLHYAINAGTLPTHRPLRALHHLLHADFTFINRLQVTILGYDLNKFSVIYSFALWFTPIALVMLSYVKATLQKQMGGAIVHSLSQTNTQAP